MPSRNLNVSNALSASRMVLAVPAAIAVARGATTVAVAVCVCAAITDMLDGYFARKFNEVTELGKIIDPISDKVFIGAVALTLVGIGTIPVWFAAIVIGRDALIFVAGVYLRTTHKIVLMSNVLGKITVALLSLLMLIVVAEGRWPAGFAMTALTWGVLAMMLASLVVYGARMVRALSKGSM